MADIRIHNKSEDLIQSAAELFLKTGTAAQQREGIFSVVLSGGSTPLPLYQLLADSADSSPLDWHKTHFFWGDERPVGPDHPDSNYGGANQALLAPLAIPPENIHRIQGERQPEIAARYYEEALARFFGERPPRFDLIFLGLGDDGHTASLFPGRIPLGSTTTDQDRLVQAVQVPAIGSARITFSAALINAAALVVFLVAGQDKASALRSVIHGPYQPETFPAQLIRPGNGGLIWLVDRDAAAKLDS